MKLFLPGNPVAWGTSMSPSDLRRGIKEEYAMENLDLNSYRDQDQETNINHLSIHLAGDPMLDPPEEVLLLDPHMKMAAAISKIKDVVDEKLTAASRLIVTGRLGLLPAFIAAMGDMVDKVACNGERFGACLTSPYGLFCPLRQTAVTESMKV